MGGSDQRFATKELVARKTWPARGRPCPARSPGTTGEKSRPRTRPRKSATAEPPCCDVLRSRAGERLRPPRHGRERSEVYNHRAGCKENSTRARQTVPRAPPGNCRGEIVPENSATKVRARGTPLLRCPLIAGSKKLRPPDMGGRDQRFAPIELVARETRPARGRPCPVRPPGTAGGESRPRTRPRRSATEEPPCCDVLNLLVVPGGMGSFNILCMVWSAALVCAVLLGLWPMSRLVSAVADLSAAGHPWRSHAVSPPCSAD
jgi:hypothetical protein